MMLSIDHRVMTLRLRMTRGENGPEIALTGELREKLLAYLYKIRRGQILLRGETGPLEMRTNDLSSEGLAMRVSAVIEDLFGDDAEDIWIQVG